MAGRAQEGSPSPPLLQQHSHPCATHPPGVRSAAAVPHVPTCRRRTVLDIHRPLLLPAPPSLSLLRALFLQHRLCLRCGSGRRALCLCCTPFPRDNGALWGVAGGLGGSTFAADRHYSAPRAIFDAGMRGSAAPLRWNRWLSWYPPLLPRRIVLCHPVAFSFATPSHSPFPPRRILLCHPVAFSFATPPHFVLPPQLRMSGWCGPFPSQDDYVFPFERPSLCNPRAAADMHCAGGQGSGAPSMAMRRVERIVGLLSAC